MKLLIGVPTAEYARRADFYDYYNMLEKPEGTICTFSHGQSPARNRNLMIDQALGHKCTHILFLDDDLAFKSDLITRLAAHDKDVVSALYLMRNYPHQPILFDYSNNKGECRHFELRRQRGLVRAVNFGLGACLINTRVFELLEKPYIRLGELEKDHWCDDIGFFNRLKDKGVELYCDLDTVAGHMTSVTVWPNIINNEWHVTYDSYGKGQVNFKTWAEPEKLKEVV
jgi:hypothetical protein